MQTIVRNSLGEEALIDARPTHVVQWLAHRTHSQRIIANRRRNYHLLAELLSGSPGGDPLEPVLPEFAVPYVFPFRVRDPESKYRALRAAGVPIFRWDIVWPGVPALPGDEGCRWATEVFQLGCHQDLSEDDVRRVAAVVRQIVESP